VIDSRHSKNAGEIGENAYFVKEYIKATRISLMTFDCLLIYMFSWWVTCVKTI
jgi:hypothetical protein